MGIENRDYFRDDEQRRGPGGYGGSSAGSWPVWQKLLAITGVAFVIQLLIPSFTDWFELAPDAVIYYGQVWRLLTYAFLHNPLQIFHILFNMLLLFFFGRRLESMYGGREFAWFYCISAIFAGICFLGFGLYFRDLTPVIGASGAVMAVTILYALHFPRERILLWGLIAVEMRWLAAFILILDLHPVLLQLSGNGFPDQVAHTAHLGGALFAWIYYSNKLRLSTWTRSVEDAVKTRTAQQRTKLKIYREESEADLEGEVDRILQKIQDHGEASLSDRERKTLQQASQKYKNRQG